MTDKILALSTCGSGDEAERVARGLVESRTAACVNIVPGVRSIYRWKGVVEDAREWLLIIKTTRARFDDLRVELVRLHSYEVPECIALPVLDGLTSYLDWIAEATTGSAD
ncbi:MAG TPA: divalent-cation tolerance protein CutA [Bryobacteraceae bacterium]|nr:divalent-cation tolerance protein CutA [Bryobacteraceae bacterium]